MPAPMISALTPLEIRLSIFLIHARRALAAGVVKYTLLHCSRCDIGFDEAPPIPTDPFVRCSIRRRCKTVERHHEIDLGAVEYEMQTIDSWRLG